MKVDFHLLPEINYIIRQLFEFGLVERWEKLSKYAANSVVANTLSPNGGKSEKHLVVLTVGHIMGAIFVMLIGHCFAILGFIAELLIERQVAKNNPGWIWLKMDAFLNPRSRSRSISNESTE